MFYDLNIPWPANAVASSSSAGPSTAQSFKKKAKQQAQIASKQSQTISSSSNDSAEPISLLRDGEANVLRDIVHEVRELGFSTVAFNQIVYSRYDPSLHPNPFSPRQDGSPRPPFPSIDPRTGKGKQKADDGVVQLSRLTIVLDEQSMGKSGSGIVTTNATSLQSYDLLAVRPTTEAAFQHACLTLSELKPFSIDIISLDLAAQPRLPFFLKRSTVHAALENGVLFEIVYGPAVGAKSDGLPEGASGDSLKARRNLIGGVRDLLRVTNGKGVFFTSGAMEALGLRGPYDVINLGAMLGLNPAAARDALTSNPRALLLRAQTRKTYRGVISHPVVVRSYGSNQPVDLASVSAAATFKNNASNDDNVNHAKKRKQPQDSSPVGTGEPKRSTNATDHPQPPATKKQKA